MKEGYLLVLVRGIRQTVCRQSRERISKSRRWGRRSCTRGVTCQMGSHTGHK